jgi:hypothetical protein
VGNKGNNKITELRTILQRESHIFFVNVWRKNIFDIYVTEYGTALTTILPILFLYLITVTVTVETFELVVDIWGEHYPLHTALYEEGDLLFNIL